MRALMARFSGWRVVAVLALALGVLGMQPGGGTLAYFTSTVQNQNNSFTAGRLNLNLGNNTDSGPNLGNNAPDSPSVATFNVGAADNFRPGMKVTAPMLLQLDTGSVPAYWGASYTSTAGSTDLRPALTLQVKKAVDNSIARSDCIAGASGFDNGSKWSALYPATTVAASGTIVDVTGTSQTIAVGDTALLCFQFAFVDNGAPSGFPSVASNTAGDNAYQGGSATLNFLFSARQQAGTDINQ